MMQNTARLRPGDFVEVKTSEEILQSLDENGTLDQLPFMPEMLEFCGRRFQVSKREVKNLLRQARFRPCVVSGTMTWSCWIASGVRALTTTGCQKACMIFWREAWLRKVDEAGAPRNRLGSGW